MDLREALDHLESLINHEALPRAGRIEGLSIDRMRELVAAMGDPHTDYPCVHVTGTNGKGSTVRMASALLHTMGLKVGTYTSPHLVDVRERIRVDGRPIDEHDFAASIGQVASVADSVGGAFTWFETMTAAAFHHFANEAIDVGVVEVGMLGRYDATNAIDGRVSVVTNVGRDHTDGAGDWRRAIAEEKAGIISPGSALVLGDADPASREVFLAEGPLATFELGRDFGVASDRLAVGGRLVDLYAPLSRHDEVFLSLHGAHQAVNSAVALAAAESFLGTAIPGDVVEEAYGSVTMPGRFEMVGHAPMVVLDGAHNPDGARAAAATLRDDFAASGRRYLVVGMQDGRDPVAILEALEASTAELVLACTAPTARGVPAAEVASAARRIGAVVEEVPGVGDALDRALALAADTDVVGVFGSFTVVGAASLALAPA
ncbi:MAG: bifunctional folylpolyglutamate synthase/dihydrofolate synthase [Acidimicrobiales bacterium]